LLVNAARRDGIALSESFMVGDRFRDIEAGDSAGCRTVLIGDGYGETFKAQPDAKFPTLSEAAEWILKQPAQQV
jgi:D-glycero-D-manno-heptose 1,7-bisphosphate phosphatase